MEIISGWFELEILGAGKTLLVTVEVETPGIESGALEDAIFQLGLRCFGNTVNFFLDGFAFGTLRNLEGKPPGTLTRPVGRSDTPGVFLWKVSGL
ncbi:MAG: hypothetical protein ABI217_07150 [Chthoniobacterales bacterium]